MGRETVVIGGGVIGLAVAYELLRRGRKVAVLERERFGGGATAAAGGMLAPISEAELEEPELVEFGQDSLTRYPAWIEELEERGGETCGYRDEGTLWIAIHRDDREELERLEETLRDKGLELTRLDAERVNRLEPHLSGRVLTALLVERDHQIDPRRLVRCLECAVASGGGELCSGMAAEAVETVGGRAGIVRGRGPDGQEFRWRADEVVLAAGAWSWSGVELPIADPGLRPVKGQLVRLRGERLLSHVVRTPDVYLVPRADGELLIGGTMEEMGFDERPTAGAAMDLLRHAWEVLPATYELRFSEQSVGFRSAVSDHLPLIGPTEVEGLFLAVGHYRNGILLAPATAHYLAEAIARDRPAPELDPFLPERLRARGESGSTAERSH